eukprot:728736-Alexandrium_andersonii.AAC.1
MFGILGDHARCRSARAEFRGCVRVFEGCLKHVRRHARRQSENGRGAPLMRGGCVVARSVPSHELARVA